MQANPAEVDFGANNCDCRGEAGGDDVRQGDALD